MPHARQIMHCSVERAGESRLFVTVHAILTATRAKNRKNSAEDVNVYDASTSIAPGGDTSFGIGEPYLSLDYSPVFHSPANG